MDLALSLGDAAVKGLTTDMGMWQLFALRSAIAGIMVYILLRLTKSTLRPNHFGWMLLRNLLLVGTWVFLYTALPFIKLSVAAAALYTLPLMITVIAALFNNEPVTKLGWFAVVIGFVGAYLILRPGSDEFNAYVLFPIAAAVCFASCMVMTRAKLQSDSALSVACWLNITFVAVALLGTLVLSQFNLHYPGLLSPHWAALTGDNLTLIAISAVTFFIGGIMAAYAYQNGPSGVIATLDFSFVGFAVLWGYLFFGETLDLQSWLGLALIVGAGIISVTSGQKRA